MADRVEPITTLQLRNDWKEYPSIDNANGKILRKVPPAVRFIIITTYYRNYNTSYQNVHRFSRRHRIWALPPAQSAKLLSSLLQLAAAESWVALEKVHGSNFCFATNGETITAARRNAVLDPVETFYDWQKVLSKIKEKVMKAFAAVKEIDPDAQKYDLLKLGKLKSV